MNKVFFKSSMLIICALLFCGLMVLSIGVYAYNKQMPTWFGVYVSTDVNTRLEIAVGDGEFYPFFDNKNPNENFTLYDKGLKKVKDTYYLPLASLKASTILHLKVYNYSTDSALNASLSVVDENISAEVYGNVLENISPAPLSSTIATTPFDTINFQVNALYKNTFVTLQLDLFLDNYEPDE